MTRIEDEDHVYNYTRLLLILLLLLHNHDNAIRLGDGARLIRLYKFFYLYFKVSHCPKYAYGTLELLAQVNHLLSPRMAHYLTWNRFVNHKGKLDTNLPMDLEVEHDNKYFKDDICAYRGEITEKSVSRVSKSMQITESIIKNFDKITHIKCPSGVHTDASIEDDVMHLVDQFKGLKLYTKIPGRYHTAFPKIKNNILEDLDMTKLKAWISKSLASFGQKHYYK